MIGGKVVRIGDSAKTVAERLREIADTLEQAPYGNPMLKHGVLVFNCTDSREVVSIGLNTESRVVDMLGLLSWSQQVLFLENIEENN